MRYKFLRTLLLAAVLSPFILLTGCVPGGDGDGGWKPRPRPERVEHGAVGLDNLTSVASMAVLNDGLYTYGTSSYNRDNTNDDGFSGGNFLYEDDQGRYVICDAKGRGMVTRIWMLGNLVDGNESRIQVYIDGGEEPVIDMSYNDFIAGKKAPFNDTFCVRSADGGVHVCYLPMAFEESIYVVMTRPNAFWQVDYLLADESTGGITSMTGEEDFTAKALVMEHAGERLSRYTGSYTGELTARAGRTAGVVTLEGPKRIAYVEFRLDGLGLPEDLDDRGSENFREVLNGLRLVIRWDGEAAPSVDAPFSLLFGMGSFGYNRPVNALMYGVKEDGTLYCYFPMPFEKSAEISVRNEGGEDVKLTADIGYCEEEGDFYNVGYFTTAYKNFYVFCQDPFEAELLDVPGTGKVVSIQENIFGQVGNVWYEEGDHRFYIDGSITPQCIGTGTEDFYNGAGYFVKNNDDGAKLGLHTLPFSGYTNYYAGFDAAEALLNEGVSCYRTFVTDAINFRNGIRLTFEHGGGEFSRSAARTWNTNQTAGYESLVCYYYQPVTKMNRTDAFDPADQAAAGSHGYTAAGEERYTLDSAFYGSFFMMEHSRDFVRGSGEISFEMALDEGNYGAVLYRVYDQKDLNLGAAVYVDGEYAGEWYKAGQNGTFRFADDYFPIPARLTAGKSAVTVTLRPDTASPWNAARYVMYSLTDRPLEETQPAGGDVYTISSGSRYLDHVDSEFDLGGSYSAQPVTAEKKSGAVEQDFRLIRYMDGTWFIVCQGSGALLSQEGDAVIRRMYPNSPLGDSERWELIPEGNGYLLRGAGSGGYLRVSGSSVTVAEKGSVFTLTPVTARKRCIF